MRNLLPLMMVLAAACAEGPAGPAGEAGPAGTAGAQGPAGENGADGASALVTTSWTFAREFGCDQGYQTTQYGVDDGAGGGVAGDGTLQAGEVLHETVTCLADDVDFDGFTNLMDSCPEVDNPDQLDSDVDGQGDDCDTSTDDRVMWGISLGDNATTSSLYTYNVEDGTTTLIGDTGHALISLDVNPADGMLYGVTRSSDPGECPNCIVTLDTTTGAATLVTQLQNGPWPSIAFLTTGDLFGWTEYGDDFGAIDLRRGTFETYGPGTSSYSHAMCATIHDEIFWLNGSGILYEVDPWDGSLVSLADLSDTPTSTWPSPEGWGIRGDCSPDGTQWIGTESSEGGNTPRVVTVDLTADPPVVVAVDDAPDVYLHYLVFQH